MSSLDFAINASLVAVLLLLLTARPVRNEDPDKWVWSKDDAENNAEKRQARYEVFENHRPHFPKQEPDSFLVDREHAYVPPGPDTGYYSPDSTFGIYGKPNYAGGHGGNFGVAPGPNGPILTGPSYKKPFRYYDTCRCTERFNCNSNGVAYGQCDVGKQYCCYAKNVGPPPNRPVHSAANGVLVGPNRPYEDQVIIQHANRDHDVLVGPGGPTGHLGFPNGASRYPSNGVLIGPGGPYDNIGNLYARSRKP